MMVKTGGDGDKTVDTDSIFNRLSFPPPQTLRLIRKFFLNIPLLLTFLRFRLYEKIEDETGSVLL